ncbi:MAG: HDOD domain-containing protein [Pseudomonadales bacterium]|nr:HDOD domain-containing protein [Pseudomonadales bacterium]
MFKLINQLLHRIKSDDTAHLIQTGKNLAVQTFNARKKAEFQPEEAEDESVVPHFSAANVNHDFYQALLNKPLNLDLISQRKQKVLSSLLKNLMESSDLRDKVTPRLPTALPRLLQCLRDDSSSINDIVDLIQQDPNVAANVLRSSNSILYNPAGKHIDSFNRATVIIGRSGLKSIACTAMMQPISSQKYSGNRDFGKQLWAHSLRTAIATQLLAAPLDMNPFTAYLAGLFHNIGEITLFNMINLNKEETEVEKANNFYFLQQQGLDPLSHEIIKLWQLTDEISDVFSGKASKELLDILQQAVVLSQSIYLLECAKISKTEFYQVTVGFGLKKHICDQTIELAEQTMNPTQH